MGFERSDLDERRTLCSGQELEWHLVWLKEPALGIKAHRIALYAQRGAEGISKLQSL